MWVLGIELRSFCLQGKHFYPLSWFPRSLPRHFLQCSSELCEDVLWAWPLPLFHTFKTLISTATSGTRSQRLCVVRVATRFCNIFISAHADLIISFTCMISTMSSTKRIGKPAAVNALTHLPKTSTSQVFPALFLSDVLFVGLFIFWCWRLTPEPLLY